MHPQFRLMVRPRLMRATGAVELHLPRKYCNLLSLRSAAVCCAVLCMCTPVFHRAGTIYVRLDSPSNPPVGSGIYVLDGSSGSTMASYLFPSGSPSNPSSQPIIAGGGLIVTAGARLIKFVDAGATVTPAPTTRYATPIIAHAHGDPDSRPWRRTLAAHIAAFICLASPQSCFIRVLPLPCACAAQL